MWHLEQVRVLQLVESLRCNYDKLHLVLSELSASPDSSKQLVGTWGCFFLWFLVVQTVKICAPCAWGACKNVLLRKVEGPQVDGCYEVRNLRPVIGDCLVVQNEYHSSSSVFIFTWAVIEDRHFLILTVTPYLSSHLTWGYNGVCAFGRQGWGMSAAAWVTYFRGHSLFVRMCAFLSCMPKPWKLRVLLPSHIHVGQIV